jgi:receptor protein-tyrosine kinase
VAEVPLPEPAQPLGVNGVPVHIQLDRLAAMGYVVPDQPRSAASEEFRHIKRQLLAQINEVTQDGSQRNRLIVISSAMPGEGKTYCAINLAMSLAMEIDNKVLLVDADVVRASVFDRLGLAPAKGLQDLLNDPSAHISDLVLATNVPNLSVLSAGTPCDNAHELLGSSAMEALLVELSSRHPGLVVVFDSPPMLLTTEARLLASRVGQVVLVVEAGRTSRQAVSEVFSLVETCPNVVSILNRCRRPAGRANGYGYGY